MITAAGGLVFRIRGNRAQVLIIHRERYDDWSLPKGKHDSGESDEEAALREIEEETGVKGRILKKLDNVEYKTGNGNRKRVTYFAVRAIDTPRFKPNSEVDRIKWVSRKEALNMLTYGFDRGLVEANKVRTLDAIGHVHLVRHAAAGNRSAWTGSDIKRPLTDKGREQSSAIAEELAIRAPSAVLSSPYVRCVQTGQPLAKALGIKVKTIEFLAEGSRGVGLLEYVEDRPGDELVMVSHGDIIPMLLDRLSAKGIPLTSREPGGRLDCKKASNWVLTTNKGKVVAAEYWPPPVLD